MDVAALEAKRHVVEREHAGKGLAHIGDFEQIFGARNRAALSDDFGGRGTDGRHGASSRSKIAPDRFKPGRSNLHLIILRRFGEKPEAGRLTGPPQARPSRGSRAAGRGVSDQFFFMNWSMLAGVTSRKGM